MKNSMIMLLVLAAASVAFDVQAFKKAMQKQTPASATPLQLTGPAAPTETGQAKVIVKPTPPAPVKGTGAAVVTQAPESQSLVVLEEKLFNILEVTGNPEFDKILALADIAPDKNTVLALKDKASSIVNSTAQMSDFEASQRKIVKVDKKQLNWFDHYVETLPGVLEVRKEKLQKFNTQIAPKTLALIDDIRGRVQTLPALKEMATKAAILATLNQQQKAELRKLYHFYFEAGTGMPDLQRAILSLYSKLENAMSQIDTSRQPARSYYVVLGVPKTATTAEIKKAFRTLALEKHPDKVQEQDKEKAVAEFAELSQAYSVLSDPAQRADYDLKNK